MTLAEANEFIAKNKDKVNQEFRLHYHGMPEIGWMNDPNGLVFYQGKYHVFYQHYPYDSIWGPMHWGHMESEDLVTFKYPPVALAPDVEDETGCFSGCAIIDGKDSKTLHLIYTRHHDNQGKITQTQAIATSHDGIHFVKNESPIISSEMIKDYAITSDVRDPAVFFQNGSYYLFVGAKDSQEHGKFLIFKSKDLKTFNYHDQWSDQEKFGTMGECPSLANVNGKDLFIYSKINHKLEQKKIKNFSEFIIGNFDLENKNYNFEKSGTLDSGHHFYAPQFLVDGKGRTLIIAWMDMWGYAPITHELGHHWFGALTFPREVKIIDQELYQYPIEEIKHYWSHKQSITKSQVIKKQVDICVDKTSEPFQLIFSNSTQQDECYEIKYDGSYLSIQGTSLNIGPLALKKSRKQYREISLRILVDTSSFEVFINEGIETMTSRVYISGSSYLFKATENLTGEIHTISIKR